MDASNTPSEAGKPKRSKASQAEYAERVTACILLIGKGHRDGEIKRIISKTFGVAPRTVEHYLCRARAELREDLGRDPEDHAAEAIESYRRILQSEDSRPIDKIKARERIDKILGLEKSTLVHVHRADPEAQVRLREELMSDPEYVEFLRLKAMGSDAEECDEERDDSEESGTGEDLGD